ncbi:MAG: uracil phosphoribosyltransferase [Puniceicoccales bacterium]|jgi:uracil phosphoribosyltransferase|nr:uracil phosphoribosyltransferase [Puniceicoccales bacterium]
MCTTMTLHLVEHPLVGKILTDLRNETTQASQFRELGKHLTYFLLIEATRGLRTKPKSVRTPLADFDGSDLGQSIAIVPILRAGLTMLQPAMEILQDVSVGYIGTERDETSAVARTYYCKLPILKDKFVIVLDPMLATGHSAEQALEMVVKQKPDSVVMVSMVVSPEGIRRLENSFPSVPIYTAAVDERLNDRKFIVPGFGDFGDRAYGTK